jgi:hypothetical protein
MGGAFPNEAGAATRGGKARDAGTIATGIVPADNQGDAGLRLRCRKRSRNAGGSRS